MGRILVSVSHFDTLCKDAWKMLEDNGHEVVYEERPFPAYSFEELQKLLPEIDACIVGLDTYSEDVWKISDRLVGASKFGVGVDNFDLAAATKYGKIVCNCPGQNSNSVAELTVGYMIDVLRWVAPLDAAMKRNEWPRYVGEEMEGKTVGLYGFGAIARLVAKKLQNFDVNMIAYDLFPNEAAAKELGVKMVSPDEVIEQSNIISLHAPATAENHHLFNKDTFARMKDGAYLINAARGGLVDLDDLAEAIKSGKIRGAALDAFEVEGAGSLKGHPIMECENVILSPHTGAESYDAYRKVGITAAQNVIDMLAGRQPKYQVNK
ncbi:MAG: phosphoglycerate dehydrogenase [Lachnospiraceae bacterium]|nr:phosphoglycerate dehydrogenase [Lachnospiraceae bacterium]